jgi:hypothetical protein
LSVLYGNAEIRKKKKVNEKQIVVIEMGKEEKEEYIHSYQ